MNTKLVWIFLLCIFILSCIGQPVSLISLSLPYEQLLRLSPTPPHALLPHVMCAGRSTAFLPLTSSVISFGLSRLIGPQSPGAIAPRHHPDIHNMWIFLHVRINVTDYARYTVYIYGSIGVNLSWVPSTSYSYMYFWLYRFFLTWRMGQLLVSLGMKKLIQDLAVMNILSVRIAAK